MLFYRGRCVLLNFVVGLLWVALSASSGASSGRNARRTNHQVCLESFDVHNDKIIRTQDSLEMGAIYLNFTDVDSRAECLKFCCDTDRCDVIIFEEKKPGSCYLFQCGPLHDFKCKFTSHANYTSAVRTGYNGRNLAQEGEIQISQQEHELKSLRKPINSSPVEYLYSEPPTKSVITLAPKLIPTTLPPPKPACSRNQYECRSSGECIAIYNVCDGIPQCADLSDEAADLVCPTEKPTAPSVNAVQQAPPPPPPPPPAEPVEPAEPVAPFPQEVGKYPIAEQRKLLPPIYSRGFDASQRQWELPNMPRQVIGQSGRPGRPGLLYQGQPVEPPNLRKGFNQRYQWDYQPFYEQNNEYNPAYREQNTFNSYEQDQPHIFNHKGPSVIGQSETDNGYLDGKHHYASHLSSVNHGTWQENAPPPPPVPPSVPSLVPNSQYRPIGRNNQETQNSTTVIPPCDALHGEKKEPTKSEGPNKPIQLTEDLTEVQHAEKTSHEAVKSASSVKKDEANLNHVQLKELKDLKEPKGIAESHNRVIVIEDHPRGEHAHRKGLAERLQQENENETENLRPRGAVISLALGLTVTAITAALIACRLRVVKRRGRRGHGPYAHDADYLVNGMYL